MTREEVLKGLVVGRRSSSEATQEESGGESNVLLLARHPPDLQVQLLQPLVALWGGFVEPKEELGPAADHEQQLAAAPVSFGFQKSGQ